MNKYKNMNEGIAARISRVLEQYPFIRLALLFGSLAKECARPESDLDLELLEITHQYGEKCGGDFQAIRKRTDELLAKGMGIADAAHVSFAESYADYFLSCDDRLIKQCHRQGVDVAVMTPVEFCIQEKLK